jgi:alpha-tubulin suppressor-like RCC1 family protein
LHSYAIAEETVYFWGKKHAYSNEVNIDALPEVAQTSKMIELPIKVDNLATGSNHTFAWNQNEVYCWGSNQFYELGNFFKIQVYLKKEIMGAKMCNFSNKQ